jgi:uncharacterized protein
MPVASVLLAVMMVAASAAPIQTYVEAQGPLASLKGTMLRPPSDKGPMMLIIPGSGPTDRDGNSPYGVKASTYRLLAEGLAEHGIGTVRIDKRGMFASQNAVADGNAVTIDDYVSDVAAWSAAIRKQTNAPCLWLLGHSEGGLVALVAARNVPGICGLVLVGAAGRPISDVIRQQLKANPANAPILPQATAAIDALESGRRFDTSGMNPALMPLFAPPLQGFLISLLSYDSAKLIASVDKPVLIMQGTRDIQIDVADAEHLKQANPKAELALLTDTNHVLKTVKSDDRTANVATYADPSLPLAPGVVNTIVNFVKDPAHNP